MQERHPGQIPIHLSPSMLFLHEVKGFYGRWESPIISLCCVMGASLSRGERIEVRGFGSFSLHYQPQSDLLIWSASSIPSSFHPSIHSFMHPSVRIEIKIHSFHVFVLPTTAATD